MRPVRLLSTAVAMLAATATLAACGGDGGDGGSGGDGPLVAFLMPDQNSTRYDEQDAPSFEKRMVELCSDCRVEYQNADADAQQQQQQFEAALADGAEVIVLDPVDSSAAAGLVQQAQSQDVAVIAYDRPIPDIVADYYVSYDNEAIGASIAQSLVDHLQEEGAKGGILQINGSPTDAAAGLIRDGVDSVVDDGPYEELAEFDTPDWQPPEAQEFTEGAISQYGDKIVGVVAANDGTGGAAIAAFRGAGVNPVPPVTGNDAEIAAIQRIIAGTQFNTISKPSVVVGEAAAEAAAGFLEGDPPEGETTLFDTPAQLFEPTVVTRENVKEIIFDGGIYTRGEVCTGEFADGCAELGIQ
jgi:D-xylose transport system substrate-binding protein